MKRNKWLAGLIFCGVAGIVAAGWSRPSPERENSQLQKVVEESAKCDATGAEACSCGTGLNRAALIKGKKSETRE